MKTEYCLTIGYFGSESRDKNRTFTYKKEGEPIISLEKIIKFFRLEDKKAKIEVDFKLVYQGSSDEDKKEVKDIWKNLVEKRCKLKELKEKLLRLLKLGDSLLPIVFDIYYSNLHIEVIDGEHTISVMHDNLKKLEELKELIEKESEGRTSPYGRVGVRKAIFEEKKLK
jgi:hypothetical protein